MSLTAAGTPTGKAGFDEESLPLAAPLEPDAAMLELLLLDDCERNEGPVFGMVMTVCVCGGCSFFIDFVLWRRSDEW